MTTSAKFPELDDPSRLDAVRRVLLAHLDAAMRDLESSDPLSGIKVHETRKAIKRGRAVLKLLRPALADADFDAVNRQLRDTGHVLASARDAKVLAEAFAAMLRRAKISDSELPRLARLLQSDSASTMVPLHDQESARASIATAREQLQGVQLAQCGWPGLAKGLRTIYKGGRRAMSHAQSARTTVALHEWRKHVKIYWHALEVFEPLDAARIGALIAGARRLAQLLGTEHDFALLAERIASAPADDDHAKVLQLLDAIAAQRKRLQRKSFALGKKVYSDRPKDMARRLAHYLGATRSRDATADSVPHSPAASTARTRRTRSRVGNGSTDRAAG